MNWLLHPVHLLRVLGPIPVFLSARHHMAFSGTGVTTCVWWEKGKVVILRGIYSSYLYAQLGSPCE